MTMYVNKSLVSATYLVDSPLWLPCHDEHQCFIKLGLLSHQVIQTEPPVVMGEKWHEVSLEVDDIQRL